MTANTQAMSSRTPIRCLVIQLSRLSDTLQSLMALRAAKQLYPQLEIHFLAREGFSNAVKRVSWLQSVTTFPTQSLLGPVLTGEKSELETLENLTQWFTPLLKETWDMVLNWSYSDSSSYLTGMLNSKLFLGYTRRPDSTLIGADGWSHYVQAIIQGRISQNIHLTDILTTQLLTALQIHAGDPLPDGNAPVTSKGFFSLALKEDEVLGFSRDTPKKWLAVQVGASRPDTVWDAGNWSKFIQYVLRRHPDYGVFLLGEEHDEPRAKIILNDIMPHVKSPQNVVSLVGKTDFDHWAAAIGRSQWLVGGDSAAIHLASVLGTRILNISVGPSQQAEAGPYGNGHYVIKPTQSETGQSQEISPEAAYATWSYASSEWSHQRQITLESHFANLGWNSALPSVQVFRSRIRNTESGGGIVFEPMIKRPLTIEAWTGMVVGQIARSWYCGWTPPIGQELTRDTLSPALIQKLRELRTSTEVLAKICEQANKTALILKKRSSQLKSGKLMGVDSREELRELSTALHDLEILIERLAVTHPPLLAFSHMSKVLMHHLQGNQLPELGRETANCYRQLSEGVQLFRDWINFTLNLVKPVAIQHSNVAFLGSSKAPVPSV